MTTHQLQLKARAEWYASPALRRDYPTPEYYWSERYQRVYCPGCRADWRLMYPGPPPAFG
jgi:hypothetical protein